MSLKGKNSIEVSLEELIYKNAGYVIKELKKKDKGLQYIGGKITGYFSDNDYKVLLEDGRIGKIKCEQMDSYDKVVDYKNGITEKFLLNEVQEKAENVFRKYINKEYYFEIIEKNNELELDIKNVKKFFLNYIIENQCLIKGIIMQVSNGHISIEIPYGLVFTTNVEFVFGCGRNSSFDYTNYIGAEISIIISYDQNKNRVYPKLANSVYSLIEKETYYIFPILTKWEKTNCSKLWLDKLLILKDKPENHPVKRINQLVLVRSLFCNEKRYTGKIDKFFPEKTAVLYRKYILAVGWMENLLGYGLEDAIRYLEDEGFCYRIHYELSAEYEEEKIISMCPDIKEKRIIPRNTLIYLTVSQGKPKEYIMPDLVGNHISTAQDKLQEQRIKFCCKYDSDVKKKVGNHCIIETVPPAGKNISGEETVMLIVYQEENYESPFTLRKGEFLSVSSYSRIVGTERNISHLSKTPWQAFLFKFILKHKMITSLHLAKAIELLENQSIPEKEIKRTLKYLQSISLIGRMDVEGHIFNRANMRFYYPREYLYLSYKDYVGYNGIFSRFGKNVRDCKIRCAENQAFLKLYSILMKEYDIQYEVDWGQKIDFDGEDVYIKIHMAIKADHRGKGCRQVYFIEAIRFLMDDEELLLDGWNKIARYNMLIARRYEITPDLLMVFEDEKHFDKFMERKPNNFRLNYMGFYYTWDGLTNSETLKFDDVFKEGSIR